MTMTTAQLKEGTALAPQSNAPKTTSRKRWIITLVVVVALLLATCLTVAIATAQAQSRQKTDLVARIAALCAQEPTSDGSLADELAIAAKLAGTDPASLTDVSVLSSLKTADSAARAVLAASTTPGTTAQTLDALKALLVSDQGVLTGNDKALADLKAADAAVLLSKSTRKATDATAFLASEITNAKVVLAGSEGKVADNAVRQALQDSIDKTTAVSTTVPAATVAAQDAQTAAVNSALTDLRAKADAVSAAVSAKAAADASAAKPSTGSSTTTATKTTTSTSKTSTSTKTSTGSTSTGSTTGSTGKKAGSASGGGTCPAGMVCQG